ncbi:septum formation initiator family protein [Staphylococcus equorum]|jgi:cell division protein DivIC|uniref:septum formation initiator family protein n=1 Tax=Staphylococcus equorum TaxID=246432 RepID=UPI0008062324|nr:septum formation initiator family protein [Staphylococcus equorum]ANQ63349.1 cell division protein DivIC [Staphylococcus equorum]MDW5472629.1 septum formation initiator family protein [Staphylococcus equorum]
MSKKVENIGNTFTSAENKKKQQQKMRRRVIRKRITLFGGILLILIIILTVMLVTQKQSNIDDAAERQEKEQQYQKQQDEELALKEQLNNLNDKSYIEKVARDDYYLSNDGEVIFKLPGEKSEEKSKSSKEDK